MFCQHETSSILYRIHIEEQNHFHQNEAPKPEQSSFTSHPYQQQQFLPCVVANLEPSRRTQMTAAPGPDREQTTRFNTPAPTFSGTHSGLRVQEQHCWKKLGACTATDSFSEDVRIKEHRI
jgi:hypothetical protein